MSRLANGVEGMNGKTHPADMPSVHLDFSSCRGFLYLLFLPARDNFEKG